MSNRVGATVCILMMVILCCATLPPLGLTQERALTVDGLARRAEVVVVGKVTAKRSEWNSDKTRIYTRVTIDVDDCLKGTSGRSIEVLVPGGEIGRVGELYTHMPRFTKDEDVIVFAEKDKNGRYRVTGASGGKYSVKEDERTGERRVSNHTSLDKFTADIRKAVAK